MDEIKKVKTPSTVWTTKSTIGNKIISYLTPYKEYDVVSIKPPLGFYIVDDDGSDLFCILKGDAHLCGEDWIIIE